MIQRLLSGEFNGVFIDTRRPIEGGLFIPIVGEKFNGNSFIKEAFKKGAKAALVEHSYYQENKESLEGYDLYPVESGYESLHEYAAKMRQHVNPYVIAITGSNGKTTTKNMMNSVLMRGFSNVYSTKGNFNNDIGLPLTILNMPLDTKWLVLEHGIMKKGDIHLLASISRPNLALVTNIGNSHLELVGSRENILREKLSIMDFFTEDDLLILNPFDALLEKEMEKGLKAKTPDPLKLDGISSKDGYYSFNYDEMEINLALRGKHNIMNALLVIEAAKYLGISKEMIVEGLEAYEGEPMRFAEIQLQGVRFINDAYNASPTSIIAGVETLLAMEAERHIAVLGDVLELGRHAEEEHANLASHRAINKLDALYTLGDYAGLIGEQHKNSQHFTSLRALSDALKQDLKEGDVVLLKASRSIELERVLENWEDKE